MQVEDGNEREATQTDLGACIDILEEVLGRKFQAGELVQTFDGRETIKVRDYEIHKIEASRIQEDQKVMIVFFKMNLSTDGLPTCRNDDVVPSRSRPTTSPSCLTYDSHSACP